jgi:hypothetical protein
MIFLPHLYSVGDMSDEDRDRERERDRVWLHGEGWRRFQMQVLLKNKERRG